MNKRIALVFAGSMLAISLAGCSKDTKDTVAADSVAADSVAADTIASEAVASEPAVSEAAAVPVAAAVVLPESIKSSGVVKVGSDITYAPYEFIPEGKDAPEGFDLDLAAAVGKKLGVEFTFENSGFDGLIPAVESGRYDVILSGMTDKAERQAKVDFVDYQTSGFSILVPAGNANGVKVIEDLCGKKVAMQKGTSQIDFVKGVSAKCAKAIEISEFPLEADAQLAIQSGRADAGVADTPPMVYFVKNTEPGKKFEIVKSEQYETALLGIAVSKKLPELRDAIAGAVNELMSDGTYNTLLAKWGLESTKIAKATINGGK